MITEEKLYIMLKKENRTQQVNEQKVWFANEKTKQIFSFQRFKFATACNIEEILLYQSTITRNDNNLSEKFSRAEHSFSEIATVFVKKFFT